MKHYILTENECALLLCILGVPNEDRSGRVYPTVEEAFSIIGDSSSNRKKHYVHSTKQMTFL